MPSRRAAVAASYPEIYEPPTTEHEWRRCWLRLLADALALVEQASVIPARQRRAYLARAATISINVFAMGAPSPSDPVNRRTWLRAHRRVKRGVEALTRERFLYLDEGARRR